MTCAIVIQRIQGLVVNFVLFLKRIPVGIEQTSVACDERQVDRENDWSLDSKPLVVQCGRRDHTLVV